MRRDLRESLVMTVLQFLGIGLGIIFVFLMSCYAADVLD